MNLPLLKQAFFLFPRNIIYKFDRQAQMLTEIAGDSLDQWECV